MTTHRLAFSVFAAVTAAPFFFAVGGCSKESASSSGAAASSASVAIAADSSSGLPNGPLAPTPDNNGDAATNGPRTPKQTCELTLKRFEEQIAQSKSCKVDTDCSTLRTGCGTSAACGVSVSTSAMPLLEKKSILWSALRCPTLMGPCPSCPAPTPPKCVAGTCQ